MNMYDIIQKMYDNQSMEEEELLDRFNYHQPYWINDDIHKRRRSSITGYELNYFKDKSLSKSRTTTTITNRISRSKPEQVLLRKNSNELQRQSTLHRLNSSTSNDSNITRIRSNEYTSITDGFKFYFNLFI